MRTRFDREQFADLNGGRELTPDEHVLVLLALVPHVRPDFFGRVIGRFLPEGGDLPEFGGVRADHHRGVLPTGETAQFVLAGDDLGGRLAVQRLLSSEHWFARRHVLWLDPVREGEPVMSGRLILDPEIVETLTTGTVSLPRFSTDFPAEHIETEMEWDDVVLHPDTVRQIREIEHWIRFNDTVLDDWGMRKRVKPGYRALFHGPPGTGKTLTATLLGKYTGRPVFRVDLSRVVSKYIGETEKNLVAALRQGRAQGLDPLLRRGGRAVRQADRGPRRPRQVRQPGGRLPPPAHRELRRAGDPRDQPARQRRRGVPAALPGLGELPDAET